MQIDRRAFLAAAAALAVVPRLDAQAQDVPDWGGPVLDTHLHIRPGPDANYVHMQGCGVTHAVIRARDTSAADVRAMQAKHPGILTWTAAADAAKPEAETTLRQAVKDGAIGLGEIKSHVAADGPEMRRLYALAADLNVSIMIHFQEVPHFDGEGVFATGFKNFEPVLKAFPRTTFIGHADAFWANLSADYANDVDYPTGPIKRGGITDRLLTDYPNLYGDMSANSCNNALSRDAEFTHDFLARHQDKLMFGSDCSCTDGRGAGIAQANNPRAARLAGKCVARETLALLKRSTTPEIFRKLAWGNGRKLFRIEA